MPRPLSALSLAVLLALGALAGALACSEDSPGGEELVRPAEREAAPVGEPGLERTEAERVLTPLRVATGQSWPALRRRVEAITSGGGQSASSASRAARAAPSEGTGK